MQALVTTPGVPHSTEVAVVGDPRPAGGELLLRTLEVGVCGTDREISEGLFGASPEGAGRLVLGHEFLGVVEEGGGGFAAGELVAATVRRSCGSCLACQEGAPDACDTGLYLERGITKLDGYASELVCELPEHLVAVPASLGHLGVLAEPASIARRGLRHAWAVGERQPWRPTRALVLGAGAIGMLATYFLRLEGYEVWTAALSPAGGPEAGLVEACGARYVSAPAVSPADVAADLGGFDVVLEATGDSQVMLNTLGLLRRNGVACLLGLDARERELTIDGRVLGLHTVIENRALLGSVNAHRRDWEAAVTQLEQARRRWPDALEAFVGLRVPVGGFEEALGHRGVKATLDFR